MKEKVSKFIRYSCLSHACFIACIVLGLGAIKIGGFVLLFIGWVLIIYSLLVDQLIFRRLDIDFYHKKCHSTKVMPDNQAIDVEWGFVKEESHEGNGRVL